MISCDPFTHIRESCFTSTGAIAWSPWCRWSNHEWYGYNRPLSKHVKSQQSTNSFHGKHCIPIYTQSILSVAMNSNIFRGWPERELYQALSGLLCDRFVVVPFNPSGACNPQWPLFRWMNILRLKIAHERRHLHDIICGSFCIPESSKAWVILYCARRMVTIHGSFRIGVGEIDLITSFCKRQPILWVAKFYEKYYQI